MSALGSTDSRGTKGKILRSWARDDALGAEIDALSHEAPARRVFAKIATRVLCQKTLRDQVEARQAEPSPHAVRPATSLELLCTRDAGCNSKT